MPVKLLIVDDDPGTVEFLEKMVSRCNFETRVAHGGIQAVSLARDFRPNCVLTGVVMPNMGGFEEAKEILKFLPNCRFILMSGNAHLQEFQDEHFALGFDQKLLLPKPFNPAELFAALKLVGFPCTAPI